MSEITTEQLKRFTLVCVAYITEEMAKHFAEQAKVDVLTQTNFFCDDIVVRVIQKIWGREVERQEHEYPSDWWQAFKARWFPVWAKERWPVDMTRVIITAKELYPNVAAPTRRPVIAIEKTVS